MQVNIISRLHNKLFLKLCNGLTKGKELVRNRLSESEKGGIFRMLIGVKLLLKNVHFRYCINVQLQ